MKKSIVLLGLLAIISLGLNFGCYDLGQDWKMKHKSGQNSGSENALFETESKKRVEKEIEERKKEEKRVVEKIEKIREKINQESDERKREKLYVELKELIIDKEYCPVYSEDILLKMENETKYKKETNMLADIICQVYQANDLFIKLEEYKKRREGTK